MSQIRSKIHSYGDENESSWPPKFPKRSAQGYRSYWDPESQTMKEGSPPDKNIYFGEAPQFITDSMPKTYHHGIGREIESRTDWRRADAASGTITFGSREDARPRVDQANERKRAKAERRKASLTALQAYRENPKEVHQKVEKQNIERTEQLKKWGVKLDD